MCNFTILNYQGSKARLRNFIINGIGPYIDRNRVIFDIFSGSGAVCGMLRNKYHVYANDSEPYAAVIADAILNKKDVSDIMMQVREICRHGAVHSCLKNKVYAEREDELLRKGKVNELAEFYLQYPTIWNGLYSEITQCQLSASSAKSMPGYHLFSTYYAGSYYGIKQAYDIDFIVGMIDSEFLEYRNALMACLFYAMKETVFSKDGHMAQPLNPFKNGNRLISQRKKSIIDLFIKKLEEYSSFPLSKYNGENRVFQTDFMNLLNGDAFTETGLVYADPPYTDMQYSRYYHLLNMAAVYDYPEPTMVGNDYTSGLYTNGRYQSKLSQHSMAKKELEKLISRCAETDTNLAMSYAYPADREKQATNRYTMSIDELEELAIKHFSAGRVKIESEVYSHANHRNSSQKKVVEYMILCGDRRDATSIPVCRNDSLFIHGNACGDVSEKNTIQPNPVNRLRERLIGLKPSKNNPVYNSHMYWSQKAFNVCDVIIEEFSECDDVVFDPFLGSGVTVLEAVRDDLSRRAVGCDINDMPLFIPKTLLSLNGMPDLENKLNEFVKKIEDIGDCYNTVCPLCGGIGIVESVLFDKPFRQQDIISISEIKYSCGCTKHGTKRADREDFIKFSNRGELANIGDTRLIHNSKISVGENDDIRNIFTPRAMFILDKLVAIISEECNPYRTVMTYILVSILHQCKITDIKGNSQWPLWIPKKGCLERNIIILIKKKIAKFRTTIEFMYKHYCGAGIADTYTELSAGKCMLLKKGSQMITCEDIPDNEIDLIITDPPYLNQVLYSEYMQLYKPFTGMEFNLDDEIVVSSADGRNKDKEEYFQLLDEVFEMCSRKLKLRHYMCLYFHDCNLSSWSRLISILEKNCFRFEVQIHINKTVTLKNIINPKKSLSGDSILVFSLSDKPIKHEKTDNFDAVDNAIIDRAEKIVVDNGGYASTPELYDDGIMEMLICNGWLDMVSKKYESLVDIFEKCLCWNSDIGKWSLMHPIET